MVFSLDRLDLVRSWLWSALVLLACNPIIDEKVTRITLAFILVMEGVDDPALEHRPQAVCGQPAVRGGPDGHRWYGRVRGRARSRLRRGWTPDGRHRHGRRRRPLRPGGGGHSRSHGPAAAVCPEDHERRRRGFHHDHGPGPHALDPPAR